MQNPQFEQKESAKKLEVFAFCPGLTKEDVIISFSAEDGVLEITGEKPESAKGISEVFDLSIKGGLVIQPKYRSEEIKAVVENGIITVTFGLSPTVKEIVPAK